MAKFTMEEHTKRMREILQPPQSNALLQRPNGASLVDKLKVAAQNIKLPRKPRL